MGCLYSIYSAEERKLIAILKHCNSATKSQFLKLKEALRFRNEHIFYSNGKRQLSLNSLICLNDIINGGFYQQINKFSFYEPAWLYNKQADASFSDKVTLEQVTKLYNSNDITEEKLMSEISLVFLTGCYLTSKILFF